MNNWTFSPVVKKGTRASNEAWSERAYLFLLEYIKGKKRFMVEEMRIASEGIVPEPPSNRAWGGVIRRAVFNKLVRRAGYKPVSNPKAHCAPCTVWEVV